MLGVLRRLHLLHLLLLAMTIAAAPSGAAAQQAVIGGVPDGLVIERQDSGKLNLQMREVLPLSLVVQTIGDLLGAETHVLYETGMLDPVNLDGLEPRDMLYRLTAPNSLALVFTDGEISKIILIGRDGTEPEREAPKTAQTTFDAAGDIGLRHEELAITSAGIRDVIKLSYRRDEAAVRELELLFDGSEDPAVRRAAISALASMGSGRAARLVEFALMDPDPEVRIGAATGLWILEGRAAEERMRAIAATDPDPSVRRAAERLVGDGERSDGQDPPQRKLLR